ncbi:MAG: hypothetical protein K0U74_09425 [Alphaproteobacteria bacterium]|nr:hypothetical protein [Alphaproteobacteria bacterium]
MTTNNAAASRRAKSFANVTILAAFLGFALAGCSTTGPLLPGAETAAQQQVPPAALATNSNKIAIAPVIGAPDGVAKQIQAQLTTAMQGRNIAIANGGGANYTLRGYVVSAREKAGTKVSYIWDVTDLAGKRVHRITGEEIAPAGAGSNPWASVTPAITARISDKTATSLAAWLPAQRPAAAPAVAGAVQAAPGAGPVRQAANTATGQLTQARAAAGNRVPNGTTTGSIGRGPVAAIVPSVTGAPGDGSVSLTTAIRKELSRNGVSLAGTPTAQSYRVEGRVALKQAGSGKQEIKIDWDVKDPTGKNLGTVSQKNAIKAGSLDGAWGRTADAAAAAAAQGILKLLPKNNTKTN